MIRILLVPSSDYLGHPFPQRHNQIFERLHDDKDFEVHVIRFKFFEQQRLKTRVIVHEVGGVRGNIATYYLLNMVKHASEVRRIVRQEGIDVVVLSNLSAPFTYTIMDEFSSMNVPIIIDLPDYYPTSAAGYVFDVRSIAGKLVTGTFDLILRHMIRRASLVTAASHALVEYARRVGARNVAYIPNGLGDHFLKLHSSKGLREKLGFSEEDVVVGYIGSVEFWLDMRSLIKGVALAKERGLPVKLLIVGESLHTDYARRVKDWIKRSELEKETVWLGFIPYEEVPKYMAVLDAGVIPFDTSNPTAYYAAPNKMWEYLSQMKPVISTPIPEALNNMDCVLMASTPNDYAQNFLAVVKRKSWVIRKIKRGYNKALKRTWKTVADLFKLTIESLIGVK